MSGSIKGRAAPSLRAGFGARLRTTIKTGPFIYGFICMSGLSGCATVSSLEAPLPLYQSIYIYSGTRLDWAALSENDAALRKFKAAAPRFPLLDLPFSFALDSMLLPMTIYAEIFH